MKRTISLFLATFIVWGVVQAQEVKYVSGGMARQMALGGSPTNAYMMDYTDVNTNPAWAVKYGDIIYSELGYDFSKYSASGQSAGFTYAIWKGLSVGLSVGKQEGPMFATNSYGSQFGGDVINSDNVIGGINSLISSSGIPGVPSLPTTISNNWRPLQVYGALKVGGITLGAAIYRVGWSASMEDTTGGKAEASIGQTGIKAGMLMDMDVMLLDASAMLRFNSLSGKVTPVAPATSDEVSVTGTELAVNARLFIKLSDKFTFVPMARFFHFGYEPEVTMAVTAGNKLNSKPDKYGRTEIEFGVGANINVPGGRVFTGLSLESISLSHDVTSFVGGGIERPIATLMRTTKYTTSVLSLPKVNLGAEFEIASWLTGRLGYFKAFASQTITTEAPAPTKKEETKYTYEFKYLPACSLAVSDQLLSLGIGLHFDRLSIDGYLAEQWLSNGPYILSGENQAMFCVLSMSYNFN